MSHSENVSVSRALEAALWIDVRASLALCRAALQALSAVAPDMRALVLESLRKEADVVRIEATAGADAIVALIEETRRTLEAA